MVGWFREAVEPGTAIVVILAEDVQAVALADEGRRFGGIELFCTSMSGDADEQPVKAFEW